MSRASSVAAEVGVDAWFGAGSAAEEDGVTGGIEVAAGVGTPPHAANADTTKSTDHNRMAQIYQTAGAER